MARKKSGFMSDGSDSGDSDLEGSDGGFNSQEDGDSRAERALFEHNGNKRRRMAGGRSKESAWEGIFGEDEEDSGPGGRGLGSRRGGRGGRSAVGARSDVTKAPTFVTSGPSGTKTPVDEQMAIDEAPEEEDVDDDVDSEDSDDDSTPAVASPRIRDEEEDDGGSGTPHVGLGGMGFRPGDSLSTNTPEPAQEEADAPGPSRKKGGRLGIGARASAPSSSRPGLGARDANAADTTASPSATPEPDRQRSAFQGRAAEPTAAPRFARPAALTAQDAAHLNSVSNSFGAKFLKNFGWNAGEGLGREKDGRAVPIAVGKHMKGQGIASGIRTEDSKREARRRGEVVSDSEDEKPKRRGAGPKKSKEGKRLEADTSWKRQKKVKVKVEHKTYEQLLAEAGEQGSGIGLVLDARGGELREVASLSALDLSGWTPTGDNAQLPELRHNLRLVVDVTKGDVEALVKEGRSVNEKKRWATREEQVARAKLEDGAKRIARLERIQGHVAEISSLAAAQAQQASPSLLPLAAAFDALLQGFKEEYTKLDLDDVVVGAIGHIMRTAFAEWQPFDISSDVLLSNLKSWRPAFRLPGSDADVSRDQSRGMTAWESLLSALWLPKVRAAINNEWSPTSPPPAVHLLESWDPILPAYIRDNILDQLILPKVKKAIEEWDGRPTKSGKTRSLSGIVFPWLPLLGHRMDDILDGSKRRIRSVMRKWVVRDGVPEELSRWRKDIFTSKEWDELMLRNVVPKLGVSLRDDFSINPRKQDMVPLEEWVLPWNKLIRSSVFSQLLEVNFFPKWLDILYIWLVQPNFKADEVANWFTWWKGRFPDNVISMPGISHGFTSGLELMQEAMQLGSEAPTRLRKAVYNPLKHSSTSGASFTSKSKLKSTPVVRREQAESTDITFRSLAEDIAAENDLVFFPIGRSHDVTGKPLFRVSKNADGRGGVLVYVGEDAVFAQGDDGQFRAISLESMVQRALA